MNHEKSSHSFHIPVMGTGYTIDTPIKVAHYGIDSVISIVDHVLIERFREFHSLKYYGTFTPVPVNDLDYRAKVTTAYLNLVNVIVANKFEDLKNSPFEPGSEITKYFDLLPDHSPLKIEYNLLPGLSDEETELKQNSLRTKLKPGAIDVNIMTKIDKVNYTENNEALPVEYNDAHASFRGFANSELNSSVVLSAGLNPRLYTYMSNFDDFFPDENGVMKKKIILKVSDYRSAYIQGKFLAKKGLWISEFRIESGLNCGGHAFATDGFLLGPILNEFKENKKNLIASLFEIYSTSLRSLNKHVPPAVPSTRITVQGGVGTSVEHDFLLDFYEVDSVGWGSPFLLVPDVTNVDKDTMELLRAADENQFYLSNVSPLGVPFNTIKGSSAHTERKRRIDSGAPGAPCVKKYLVSNTDYTNIPICTASVQYQKNKLKELRKQESPDNIEFKEAFNKIVDKVCLCVGLGNSSLAKNNLANYDVTKGMAICPGPNLAYFSKISSLKEMADHIYGRINIMKRKDRPSMFIKELNLYIDFLRTKIDDCSKQLSDSQIKYIDEFKKNLNEGINYYRDAFENLKIQYEDIKSNVMNDLVILQIMLNSLELSKVNAV
jgi:hypothetical protein